MYLPVKAISVLLPGLQFSGQSVGLSSHCCLFWTLTLLFWTLPSSSYTVSLPPARSRPPESLRSSRSHLQGRWPCSSLSDDLPASYCSRGRISQHALPRPSIQIQANLSPLLQLERPPGAVEMALQLKMLPALEEDPNQVQLPTPTTVCDSRSRGSNTLFWPLRVLHTCAQTHTHK